MINRIDEFRDENFFLSNFYDSNITYEGITYKNSEAAFQAQKCKSKEERKQFENLIPRDAKKKGRHVDLREDWESVKLQIMEDIVRAKFTQNLNLRKKLIETGDAYLTEGNWWKDTYWGVCNGNGENHLGKILMKIRKEFQNGI